MADPGNLFDNPPVGQRDVTQPTVVTIGQVELDDNDAKYIEITDGIYTDYFIENSYEKDRHIYMDGITSPGGFQGASVAFFQLAAPTLLWICKWTAAKFAVSPLAPDSTSKDPNWVLLDDSLVTASFAMASDGVTPLYRLSGVYVYGHKNPSAQISNNVVYPRPPWLEDVFDRTVPLNSFQQGLSNSVGSSSSTGGSASIGGSFAKQVTGP